MLERGTHDAASDMAVKSRLTADLLQAASLCGPSLQKALALPEIATLCARLASELLARTWRPSSYLRFAVQEPKLREVFAPAFADRVVQSWLVARVDSLLERTLIEDTYANRPNRGPLAAIRKAQSCMRRPGNGWCLQLDVRSYFHSIHRPTLLNLWLALLERHPVPDLDLIRLVSRVLLEHNPISAYRSAPSTRGLLAALPRHKTLPGAAPDCGLPIGSTSSQHFANFYLNPLDHFIKHELRVKGYLRYMDDLTLFGPGPAVLLRQRDAIADFLAQRLRLALHPGKERLTPSAQGIEYLGYRVYPHYLHPGGRTVHTLKARLDFFKHLVRPDAYPRCQRPVRGVWHGLAETGDLTPPLEPDWRLLKRMEATINAYFGLLGHAQSWRLRKNLYHKHFGPLRAFFVPADAAYKAVRARKCWRDA